MMSVRIYALLSCLAVASCVPLHASRVRGAATPELIEYLSDDRSWVREEAARGLGDRATGARALERILLEERERAWVRAAAAEALGRIGERESIGVLAGVAHAAGVPPEVKLAVIGALCVHRAEPEALQAIEALSSDDDLLVSAAAQKESRSKCAR